MPGVGRRQMPLLYRQMLLVAVAAVTSVVIWAALWSFVARDQCLDSGGALRASELACEFVDGRIIPLMWVVRPAVTLVSVAAVAASVIFVVRGLFRRLK